MSEILIGSSNITVFPCVSRTLENDDNEVAIKAKLMSEENITNILKSITDKESYVISCEPVMHDGQATSLFKFVLNGYYVELLHSKPADSSLYAILSYANTGNSHILIEGDDSSVFKGIKLATTEPTAPAVKYLCLCRNGVVPDDSFIRFDRKSISFDFGELNYDN